MDFGHHCLILPGETWKHQTSLRDRWSPGSLLGKWCAAGPFRMDFWAPKTDFVRRPVDSQAGKGCRIQWPWGAVNWVTPLEQRAVFFEQGADVASHCIQSWEKVPHTSSLACLLEHLTTGLFFLKKKYIIVFTVCILSCIILYYSKNYMSIVVTRGFKKCF